MGIAGEIEQVPRMEQIGMEQDIETVMGIEEVRRMDKIGMERDSEIVIEFEERRRRIFFRSPVVERSGHSGTAAALCDRTH
jgi:hypothetical protein